MIHAILKIVLGGLLVVTVIGFLKNSDRDANYLISKESKTFMTPDIKRLQENIANLQKVLAEIDFEFIDDSKWSEPSDTSYLNENDRADPDIMANVDAMEATNKLIAWFGRDQEGGFVGLWQGPENTPLEHAPVVRLNNEGQYEIVAATVPDYIAIADMDEENFDNARSALLAVGFNVAASRDEIWEKIGEMNSANAFRHEIYNRGRVLRGLKSID